MIDTIRGKLSKKAEAEKEEKATESEDEDIKKNERR